MSFRSTSLLAALLASGALASAQDFKVNACVELWYTQMMDSNLRLNGAAPTAGSYYNLNAAFKENGLSVRRSEIYVGGNATPDLAWMIMFDPNTTASSAAYGTTVTPNILADAFLTWKGLPGVEIKVGQFKPPTSYEASMVGAPALYFYDRSMLNRQFADRRDRGVQGSYVLGNAKGFNAKAILGVFDGSCDRDQGRANDANAQKDFAGRLEMGLGTEQKWGAYYRAGSTDAADKGLLQAAPFGGTNTPASADVLAGKDRTTTWGAYYVYDTSAWFFSGEVMGGELGRRFPSVASTKDLLPADPTAFIARREHLDQKFMGYTLTGVCKLGAHQITARYDFADYNTGSDWYGPNNPYTTDKTGASRGADYTPRYTEIVLGYNYLFNPTKLSTANVKLNYIHRSANFLAPRAGQSGEQGGDSLVAVLKVGF